ncbi:hypothetical protein BHE74_00032266 [Ensete ventricosum]|nr:hypothetical protein BHE74_00032266 [Ensete ventricosum]RZR98682.1 hypothetical protein BHM03_00028096 [Ensete ventricosum]
MEDQGCGAGTTEEKVTICYRSAPTSSATERSSNRSMKEGAALMVGATNGVAAWASVASGWGAESFPEWCQPGACHHHRRWRKTRDATLRTRCKEAIDLLGLRFSREARRAVEESEDKAVIVP